MYQACFPQATQVVDMDLIGESGAYQYQFNEYFAPAAQSREADPSLWEVRIGVKYDF